MVDQQPKVIGMGAGQEVRVGYNNDPFTWYYGRGTRPAAPLMRIAILGSAAAR